jgi:hypothetical protein
MFAHVVDGVIEHTSAAPMYKVWNEQTRVFDTSNDREDLAALAEAGWYPVTDAPKPDDTDTGTTEYTVQLVDGTPTVVWKPRDWTAEELVARQSDSNERALRDSMSTLVGRALDRQAAMQAIIDTQNSTINANPAQYIKLIARAEKRSASDVLRMARLVGGMTDSADVGDET